MEGYALTALGAAVLTGAAYWLTMGRQIITKKEHAEYCVLVQKPMKIDIDYLSGGQERLEKKVDALDIKVDSVNIKVDAVAVKLDMALKVLRKINGDKD